jgi:predicted RNA-binding protein YlxR (DUF448 family)
MASDDTPVAVLDEPTSVREIPERKCILTGAHGERADLIRLALGPDGAVWPDLGARLPGRGAWITPDRTALETAIAKGKFKGAIARAFKEPATVPDDLSQKIADGLARRALDRLGLELRAGHLIFGSEKLSEHARAGRLRLLLHAGDAADDGVQKLDQAWRVGGGDMAAVFCLPAGREALSRALGRENIVHSGVLDGKAAARIATDVRRWLAFRGSDGPISDGGDMPGRRNDEGRE